MKTGTSNSTITIQVSVDYRVISDKAKKQKTNKKPTKNQTKKTTNKPHHEYPDLGISLMAVCPGVGMKQIPSQLSFSSFYPDLLRTSLQDSV